ncbi:MAG: endonuclease/exonuclease/phosphatase family protein [Gemmatimonadota bacterium]
MRSIPRALLLALVAVVPFACTDDVTPDRLLAPDGAVERRADGNAGTVPVRLMSRNVYLGADIDHVLADPEAGGDIAWAEIMYANFPERAAELAEEIVARMPHLVGLQEVSEYVVLHPVSYEILYRLDFLEILMDYLGVYGAKYEVVTESQNFQARVPMGGHVVRYTDSDVILALAGVEYDGEGWKPFEEQVNLGDYVAGLGFNYRSYQWAEVEIEGQSFLFVNTHFEIQRWAEVQEEQAAELLAFVDGYEGPTFMVGDFNSAANRNAAAGHRTGSYQMILDAGFHDLWLPHDGVVNNSGLTCCQASDLSNTASELDQRIDFIFARAVPYWKGNRRAAAKLEVVGERPSDRFLTSGEYYLWPSDHAGLFGEILIRP